jgi:hypothetical protein
VGHEWGIAALSVGVFVVVALAVFVAGAFVPDRPAGPGRDDALVMLIYLTPAAIFLVFMFALVSVALWIAGPVETW